MAGSAHHKQGRSGPASTLCWHWLRALSLSGPVLGCFRQRWFAPLSSQANGGTLSSTLRTSTSSMQEKFNKHSRWWCREAGKVHPLLGSQSGPCLVFFPTGLLGVGAEVCWELVLGLYRSWTAGSTLEGPWCPDRLSSKDLPFRLFSMYLLSFSRVSSTLASVYGTSLEVLVSKVGGGRPVPCQHWWDFLLHA